jgi:hypothetical protein
MKFMNSQKCEYEIRLNKGQIAIDHEDRPGMTVSEYVEFAGVPLEWAYFRQMDVEIRQALIEDDPNGIVEITEGDLKSLSPDPSSQTLPENIKWTPLPNGAVWAVFRDFEVYLSPDEGYADIYPRRDYAARLPSDDRSGLTAGDAAPYFRMFVPSYASRETGIQDEETDLRVEIRNDNGDVGRDWPAGEKVALKSNPDHRDCSENNRAWIGAIESFLRPQICADALEDALLEGGWILEAKP